MYEGNRSNVDELPLLLLLSLVHTQEHIDDAQGTSTTS